MFDAVSRILVDEENLDNLCDSLAISRFVTTDLQYLHDYTKMMSPIALALDFLQREDHLLYGCLIPCLVSLSVKLRKIAKGNELLLLSAVALLIEEKLRQRFSSYFTLTAEADDAIAAAVLSPDVKMRWFTTFRNSQQNRTAQDIHNMIISLVEKCEETSVEEVDRHISTNSNTEFYEFETSG